MNKYQQNSLIIIIALILIIQITSLKSKAESSIGWVNIVGKTGLCIGVNKVGEGLVQKECKNTNDLLWKATKNPKGFIIVNKKEGIMDNYQNGTKDGNKVVSWALNKTPGQLWSIKNHIKNTNFIEIKNIKAGKCLDDNGGKINEGLRIWKCDKNNENQMFRMQIPDPNNFTGGKFNIIGKGNLCISAENSNGKLLQRKCKKNDSMIFTMSKNGSGFVLVTKTGLAIDNFKSLKGNGNPIMALKNNKTPAQIWGFENAGKSNEVIIKNIQVGKCIDIGKLGEGRDYRIWDCDKNKENQRFRLEFSGN